jgi:protein TonB
MDTKKEPGKELSGMTPLFRSFGFLLSLSMVAMAFEWRSYDEPVIDLRGNDRHATTEIIDAPITEIIPPKPAPRVIVVVEPTEVEPEPIPEPLIDLGNPTIDNPQPLPVETPEVESEIAFIVVEESASPAGGLGAFYAHIKDQLKGKYPAIARRMGIEGRVFLEFVVEKNGALTDIRVVKGIGGGCDELALKVLAASPAWKPGKQRGKPVRQRLTLPIFFKLG